MPWVPPRGIARTAWFLHRAIYRASGRRLGLYPPRGNRFGVLRLTTRGRRTGRARSVLVAYLEDGADLVVIAMNGWGPGHPAWWLNLRAHPRAAVEMPGGARRPVLARAAEGDERIRLWERWRAVSARLDDYAAARDTPTDVVVLAPLGSAAAPGSPEAPPG